MYSLHRDSLAQGSCQTSLMLHNLKEERIKGKLKWWRRGTNSLPPVSNVASQVYSSAVRTFPAPPGTTLQLETHEMGPWHEQ